MTPERKTIERHYSGTDTWTSMALLLENKLKQDTHGGCSVCGYLPVVNVYGTYWLCGSCVSEKLTENVDEIERLREAIELESDHLTMIFDNFALRDDLMVRLKNINHSLLAALKERGR